MDLLAEVAHLHSELERDARVLATETETETEREQIAYLKEMLQHQKELYCREEEKGAFLASMMMRGHFRNLTESAFYSAFRKKNIHPDDLGKENDVSSHTEDICPSTDAPLSKRARMAEDEGVWKGHGMTHGTDKGATTGAGGGFKAGKTLSESHGERGRERGKHGEKKDAPKDMAPPSQRAGEAARLLGERLLQQLASSSSTPPAPASSANAQQDTAAAPVALAEGADVTGSSSVALGLGVGLKGLTGSSLPPPSE